MLQKIVYNEYHVNEENEKFLEVHQLALDKFGLPFTEVSDKSWWNPKEEMYYLCEKDSRKFRSRLDNTQLSTTHIEIPYIPWTWEPFES
jgi:hypothetical protein